MRISHNIAKFIVELGLSSVYRVLEKGGLFIGFSMCNQIPEDMKGFCDEKTGIMSRFGIAGRYIGKDNDILNEFTENNFKIIEYQVEKARDNMDSDNLIYVLKK